MTLRLILAASLLCASSLPAVADYLSDRKTALEMMGDRQFQQAADILSPWGEKSRNDVQQADALSHAALALHRLGRPDEAMELVEKIRSKPMATFARMELFQEARQWKELLDLAGTLDVNTWPEKLIYPALVLRAQAHAAVGQAAEAEADLVKAQEYTISVVHKARAALQLADLIARGGGDPNRALEAYAKVVAFSVDASGLRQKALLARARLLADRQQWDQALAEAAQLEKANNNDPHWIGSAHLVLGEIYEKQGNPAAALESYRKAAAVPKLPEAILKEARMKLDALEGGAAPAPAN